MIIQRDLQGNEIARYDSIRKASKACKIDYSLLWQAVNMHNCLTKGRRSPECKGFLWEKEGVMPIDNTIKLLERKCTYRIIDVDTEEGHICGKIFMSEGNWNHYCPSCQEIINRKASATNLKMKAKLMPTNISSRTPRIDNTVFNDLMWM